MPAERHVCHPAPGTVCLCRMGNGRTALVVTQEKRTGKPVMVNKVIQITQEQHQFLKRLKAETAIPGNVFFRQLLNEYIEKYNEEKSK